MLDLALVPCGGGGLIAGCALALTEAFPGIAIYAVEPAGLDDTRRSLEAGARQVNAPAAHLDLRRAAGPDPGRADLRDQPAAAGGRPRSE